MIKDIATDHLADNLSENIPEIKIHGQEASNVNNVTKTTASDASSKAIDMGRIFKTKRTSKACTDTTWCTRCCKPS